MAQEFASLPSKVDLGARTAGRSVNTVNMYLPTYVTFVSPYTRLIDLCSHHHIESVHFATPKGEALHDAVAVVQTPGREYYVLRYNGMQVGCEEEGIPEVWQKILGCDTLGRPCQVCTVTSSYAGRLLSSHSPGRASGSTRAAPGAKGHRLSDPGKLVCFTFVCSFHSRRSKVYHG